MPWYTQKPQREIPSRPLNATPRQAGRGASSHHILIILSSRKKTRPQGRVVIYCCLAGQRLNLALASRSARRRLSSGLIRLGRPLASRPKAWA